MVENEKNLQMRVVKMKNIWGGLHSEFDGDGHE